MQLPRPPPAPPSIWSCNKRAREQLPPLPLCFQHPCISPLLNKRLKSARSQSCMSFICALLIALKSLNEWYKMCRNYHELTSSIIFLCLSDYRTDIFLFNKFLKRRNICRNLQLANLSCYRTWIFLSIEAFWERHEDVRFTFVVGFFERRRCCTASCLSLLIYVLSLREHHDTIS